MSPPPSSSSSSSQASKEQNCLPWSSNVENSFIPSTASDSKSDVSSTLTSSTGKDEDQCAESSTDVIQEVRNQAKKDNQHVQHWRTVLVAILLATGFTITFVTFRFLREDEYAAFETAYDQFSTTVGSAALRHHQDIRNEFRSMAKALSSYAEGTNQTWPFVTIPYYESHAQEFIKQARVEVVAFYPVIKHELRDQWIEYVNNEYEAMIHQSHILHSGGLERLQPVGYHPFISKRDPETRELVPDKEREVYFPAWHYSPPPFTYGLINWNVGSIPPHIDDTMEVALEFKNETITSNVRDYQSGTGTAFTQEEHEAFHSKLPPGSSTEHPHSFLRYPVHEKIGDDDSPIVGILSGALAWDASMLNLLPKGVAGMLAVIKNTCGQEYTYEIDGPEAIFLGEGDLHEEKYEDYEIIVDLALHTNPAFASTPGHCLFSMHIFPSTKFEDPYHSNVPMLYAIVVASTFVLVTIVFFIYNIFVNRRNEKLVQKTAKSNAVISALFPKSIRDRILEDGENNYMVKKNIKNPFLVGGAAAAAAAAAAKNPMNSSIRPPLADYFPETTILFADISGFTAWSSVREPPQVFSLLESLYGAFDELAKRMRVFKVETVGDCYVAATGIPDFHQEHALWMVRFARKILTEMDMITKKLEITLGPDTGDLSLRIGIHSGPITAGVLRGDRARFQLFGDTVNTASRMESSGEEGRIHLSSETAELIKKCGKQHWLVKRGTPVKVKGKGDIQTYWAGTQYDHVKDESLGPSKTTLAIEDTSFHTSVSVQKNFGDYKSNNGLEAREARLVDWNVHMLIDFLKQIVARRIASKGLKSRSSNPQTTMASSSSYASHQSAGGNHIAPTMEEGFQPLDEVREVIRLPEFDSKIARLQKSHHIIELPPEVTKQLHKYVTCIASMYRRNHFHNFEHASHVTMSVIKLLSRIVAPTDLDDEIDNKPGAILQAQLHDHTYGITSDPLTQFACAFCALIHDADHSGVPNAQLVKEQSEVAKRYNNRSVAEQNSMVLAWNLLMEERFKDLRLCLCETPRELRRFRYLVVNGVMATDITDKELKNLRNARWEKAFKDPCTSSSVEFLVDELPEQDLRDGIHRKATIVIEHLLQASDVAHTMQHWHVYRKWNERFFRECYAAYKAGRAEKDPSEGWYEGEIGFFDFYIIPLARKLDTCGVFGKSSDEYLSYALQNREEWKTRGKQVVDELVKSVQGEYSSNGTV